MHGPVLKKRMRFCACAKSRDLLKVPQISYCSCFRLRRFTVLDFKSWAYSLIYGHFQQLLYAHAQKRLFMNFRYKCRHSRSIRRTRFPVREQNFGDLATFSVDFCILYAECPPYFLLPVCLYYWPKSIPHASTPTSIIPTKFEAPTPIRSWVMSDNVSHWLPLKMRTRPLRMRRITWPVSRGSKKLHFWNSDPICLFAIQLLLSYDYD